MNNFRADQAEITFCKGSRHPAAVGSTLGPVDRQTSNDLWSELESVKNSDTTLHFSAVALSMTSATPGPAPFSDLRAQRFPFPSRQVNAAALIQLITLGILAVIVWGMVWRG
jgi:hypothetical protein